jgi:hypothetical protein
MSRRATALIAAAVAILILLAGLSLAAARDGDYRSTATLLLSPKPTAAPDSMSTLLDSFGRSGTSGTYVQLISSRDTLRRSGASGVSVEVTPVPDARTIDVETTGPEEVVRPALSAIIRASQEREAELGDVWRLQILGSPSQPEPAGVTRTQLIGATILLALMGALFVVAVLNRYRLAGAVGLGRSDELGAPSAPAGPLPELEEPAQVRVRFDLESFRYVKASPTTVLLQVTGYWRAEHPRRLTAPNLQLHETDRVHPIAPLSTPDAHVPEAGPETPLWRGSYAAPVEIFERADRVALRAASGVVIGLPDPTEQDLLVAARRENGADPVHDADTETHDAHDEHVEDAVTED